MVATSTSCRVVSRRGIVRASAGTGIGLAAGIAGGASAQDAAVAPHPIVGAWRIIPDQPGPQLALIVYHADGTLTFSVPAPGMAPPGAPFRVVFDTPAYGVWESTGDRAVVLTATAMEANEQGEFLGTLTFYGTVEIDDSEDAYQFAGEAELVDPDGAVLETFPVSTRATRMRVDHERASVSPPTSSTPVA